MSTRSIARQGFTLVELLVTLIVAAIVGAALLRLMMGQARFMDQEEASRSARSVARSGINRLVSDLRAVEATGGLVAAVAGGQDFTVRVPYAFGVVCSHLAAVTTVNPFDVRTASRRRRFWGTSSTARIFVISSRPGTRAPAPETSSPRSVSR